jgi:uncharacterized protein YbjT (DUF2867 family)
MTSKVLVLGANGNVGKPLVKTLLAKGENIKAASRTGKSVEGTEGVVFDFLDPSTYEPAFDGVDRAYIMLPTGYVQSRELLTPLIEIATAGSIKIVLQSAFGVDADDSIPYRQVEITLEKSGSPYVILRPNWFSDNFHTIWKSDIEQGMLTLPAGDGKSSFIDARDIAECAAVALTDNRFTGKAYDLTGPEALSYADAANILSRVIGKPIAYTSIDDISFIEKLKQAGLSEDYAQFLASLFYPVREGWTSTVTDSVKQLTNNAPRSLKTYAEDHAALLLPAH